MSDQLAIARRPWGRRIVVDTTVHHRVEVVFAHLADPMRWHEFAPAVVFRQPVDEGPLRVGSRWRSTDRIGPFRIHFIDELAELEHDRRVVWLSSHPWNARVEYACHAEGEHTRISATYEGDLGGSLRWQVGWLPSWLTRLILAQDFRRLDRLLARRAWETRRWHERHGDPTEDEAGSAPRPAGRASWTGI